MNTTVIATFDIILIILIILTITLAYIIFSKIYEDIREKRRKVKKLRIKELKTETKLQEAIHNNDRLNDIETQLSVINKRLEEFEKDSKCQHEEYTTFGNLTMPVFCEKCSYKVPHNMLGEENNNGEFIPNDVKLPKEKKPISMHTKDNE